MKPLFKNKPAKEQVTPFKDLSFSQKAHHIWEYYKYFMISAVLIIIAVVSFVISFQRNNYTTVFSMVIIDGKMTGYDTGTDKITTDFTQYLGIDGKDERVECDYNYSLIPKLLDQDVSASEQKLYMLASTASIDGYISSRDYIDYFSTDKEVFFYDLREVLTLNELDKLSDKIIYYTKEDGTQIPIALDISKTKIKTETNFTMDDPCYGIVVTAPNLDNAVSFIRYAFDL